MSIERISLLHNYAMETKNVGYKIWALTACMEDSSFEDYILKDRVEGYLGFLLQENEELIWALENDCLYDPIDICYHCGRKTTPQLARIFSDELVICCWCNTKE